MLMKGAKDTFVEPSQYKVNLLDDFSKASSRQLASPSSRLLPLRAAKVSQSDSFCLKEQMMKNR